MNLTFAAGSAVKFNSKLFDDDEDDKSTADKAGEKADNMDKYVRSLNRKIDEGFSSLRTEGRR